MPDVRPFTTPDAFTVATTVLVLLHTPPVVASVNVVDEPAIIVAVPLIVPAAGEGLTVITWVAAAVPQPLVTVYDMVVVPDVRPITIPEAFTVATTVLVLLHTPPLVASVKVVDELAHTLTVPMIVPADGKGLTVTTWVAAAVTLPLVTV